MDEGVGSGWLRNAAVSGGSSLTVTGLRVGAVDLRATDGHEMDVCMTSAWTSATTLACSASSASTMYGVSAVSVGGVAGTASAVYSFDAAVGSGWLRLSLIHL